MNDQILDIPQIQKEIKDSHQKFIADLGSLVEKVIADYRLSADIIISKIFRIGICLKEEGVVDSVEIVKNGPYKKISFLKDGYDTYIYVSTNGKMILFEGYNYSSDMGFENLKRTYNIDGDDYDWVKFSKELLDYIHSTIYQRQDAVETKINTMFNSPSDNEEQDIIAIKTPKK